jgi:O-glycosyl hydrolase
VSVVRYDWSGFTGVTLSGSKFLWDAGVRTFIGSCWSPPANMKSNSSTNNGGSLNTASYAAFVDWLVGKLNEFKQTTGGDLYAISIQNEPAFVEFYASCVYTAQQLRDVVKLVGQRFERDGIATKIFMPEEVFDQWASLRSFIGVACSDTSANKYIDALAFHGLGSDGISPSDLDATNLRALKALADRFGKRHVWNTEAGGGTLHLDA